MFNTHASRIALAVLTAVLLIGTASPVMAQATQVQGAIAPGSNSAQYPVVIGGVDGSNLVRALRASPTGIFSAGYLGTGQDGFDNTNILYLKDIEDASGIQMIAPMIFNPISGKWDRQRFCNLMATTTVNAIGSSQFLTGTSGKNIYICSVTVTSLSGNNSVSLASGTGSVCATGTTDLTGWIAALSNDTKFLGGNTGYYAVSGASHNLCLSSLTANTVAVAVKYALY